MQMLCRRVIGIAWLTLFGATSSLAGPMPPPAESKPTAAPSAIFISGHSLIDQPIPDYLAGIAQSMGSPLEWNRQYMEGSPILARVRGRDRKAAGWAGYRSGRNREGQDMDVVEELRHPRTVTTGRYDALLITEQHGLLGSLTWNDTVRYLRHYHDRFIEGNPQGTTFFYESWISMDDKSNPRRWIGYERDASPIWQCIATRINVSLAAEGRTDRIKSLPAGAALAELVDRATSMPGLPGITRGSARETVDSLIADGVHPTNLGRYYVALVSYAVIYGKSPAGAWHPQEINATQAQTLQQLAGDFAAAYRERNVPLTLEQCRQRLTQSFISEYWEYTRDAYMKNDASSIVRSYVDWARYLVKWHLIARSDSRKNPFYFDSANDRDYWFPVP